VEANVEMVREVEQVGVQDADEKDVITPEGRPETEKATDCAVPETRVALVVVETEAPWVTALLLPLVREKLKAVDAVFTVKAKLVVLVTRPPVAVTVIV